MWNDRSLRQGFTVGKMDPANDNISPVMRKMQITVTTNSPVVDGVLSCYLKSS